MDRKLTTDPMQMLDLNETIDQQTTVNSVRWYGHELRKDKSNFQRMAIDLRVRGTRKRGRPKYKSNFLRMAINFKGKGVDQRKPD